MGIWEHYYKKSQTRALRPLYIKALEYLKSDVGVALDLGCGAGVETHDLLKRGFVVHAIDQEQSAIDFILKSQRHLPGYLKTQVVSFEKLSSWPTVDFLFSYLALPFCSPEFFTETLSKVKSSVKPGGLIAVSFLGPKDDWVIQNKVVGISRDEIIQKFARRFEILYLEEIHKFDRSASGPEKQWHIIELIAKKSSDVS